MDIEKVIPPKIGDNGAIYLATALMSPHDSQLKVLSLPYCDIGRQGVLALSVALCFKNNLCHLNLSGNKIVPEAEKALKQALHVNTNLQELTLSGCHLGKKGVANLQALLKPENKPQLTWEDQKKRAQELIDLRLWILNVSKEAGLLYPKNLEGNQKFQDKKMQFGQNGTKSLDAQEKVGGYDAALLGAANTSMISFDALLQQDLENLQSSPLIKAWISKGHAAVEKLSYIIDIEMTESKKLRQNNRDNEESSRIYQEKYTHLINEVKTKLEQLQADELKQQRLLKNAEIDRDKTQQELDRALAELSCADCLKKATEVEVDAQWELNLRYELQSLHTKHLMDACSKRNELVSICSSQLKQTQTQMQHLLSDLKLNKTKTEEQLKALQKQAVKHGQLLSNKKMRISKARECLALLNEKLSLAQDVLKKVEYNENLRRLVPVSCGDVGLDSTFFLALWEAEKIKVGLDEAISIYTAVSEEYAAFQSHKNHAIGVKNELELRIKELDAQKLQEQQMELKVEQNLLVVRNMIDRYEEDGKFVPDDTRSRYATLLSAKADLMTKQLLRDKEIQTSVSKLQDYQIEVDNILRKSNRLTDWNGMAKEDFEMHKEIHEAVMSHVKRIKHDFDAVKRGPEDNGADERISVSMNGKSCADVIVPKLALACKVAEGSFVDTHEQRPTTTGGGASLGSVSEKGMSRKQLAQMKRLKALNAIAEANLPYQQQLKIKLDDLRVQSLEIKEKTHQRKMLQRLERQYLNKALTKPPSKLLQDLQVWSVCTDNLYDDDPIRNCWAAEKAKRNMALHNSKVLPKP